MMSNEALVTFFVCYSIGSVFGSLLGLVLAMLIADRLWP